MSYDNNEGEYENNAPKKADVLIQSTHTIVAKQQELAEQTKLAISRIDEAIELCQKNSEEASYILNKSTEMFEKLEAENSSLKQELLYLAKQSENIYAGLADKLTEMEQEGITGQPADVSALTETCEKLNQQLDALAARVEALTRQSGDGLNDKFAILYDKVDAVAVEAARPGGSLSSGELASLNDKLDRVLESVRKNESAHSMLADKFEILSMRVEQFGYGGNKPQQGYVPPVAPFPVSVPSAEIDYDKLAAKVAEILSVKDVVSPDYIASKVAEQIVLPEANTLDAQEIADKVAGIISEKAGEPASEVTIDEDALAEKISEKLSSVASADVTFDEEALAEKVAQKVNVTLDEDSLAEKISEKLNIVSEPAAADETVAIDEDALADKIASRLSGSVTGEVQIDQEDLADSIALKVGSLKPDDFEILVDDAGCSSISKEIADKLDYRLISEQVADKLREILDINAANAPDYEDMAERISEKITVAGINEDAIADKAAAVLSNYLPEFDVDEIADKVTGAVIDVVSAMPQPTLDNETLCNEICERLIEKQEENNYDIVVDDDGIARISAIVNEEIENKTSARFDKLEEGITRISDMLDGGEAADETAEDVDLADVVAEEVEKATSSRFDKVDEDIAKIYDIVSNIVVEEGEEESEEAEEGETVEETEDESYVEDEEYHTVSELVSNLSSRFDDVESKLDSLTDLMTADETEYEEGEEETDGEETEEVEEESDEYSSISEIVAAEIERSVTSRFDTLEENIKKISAVVGGLAAAGVVADGAENVALYEQFDKVTEDIKKLTEYIEGDGAVAGNERLDKIAAEVEKLSALADGGLPLDVQARLDKLQQDIDAIKAMLVGGIAVAATAQAESAPTAAAEAEEEQELVKVSEIVEPDEDGDDDFKLGDVDMDAFADERMPGEIGEYDTSVDFENMMKYNRSFIARIIQSDDECKQYYGELKHALLSYKKVNSNVAWGNERFNKGRETIARIKIRGKTLVVYLALDPNEYKTSVYHQTDVSDNKSVLGTPMMVKVKSPLGVKKAIRLIDEMLEKRGGEKRNVPERDYAAMYPYETIEELIEDGLVKDVRK